MSTPTPAPSGPSPTPTVPGSSKDLKSIRDAQAQAAAQNATAYYDPENPPIFLGWKPSQNVYVRGGATAEQARAAITGTADVKSYNDVANQYYTWDEGTKQKFRTELALTGLETDRMSDAQLQKAWASYVAQSGAYWQNGNGRGLTPWDIVSMDRSSREKVRRGPTTTTSTSTALDISTRQDAAYIAQQAARSLLGRDPTQQETTKLLGALNAYERNNPRVSTSTTVTQPAGAEGEPGESTSTSTTTGGVGEGARAMIAQEQLKQGKEYGAYQAATTYFNAMMQTLYRGY